MSFSRLIGSKPIYCLKNSLTNKQNSSFSLKVKYFHSFNSKPNKSPKLMVKSNMNCRYLSTVRADTTIEFKPEVIDLSGGVSGLSGEASALVQELVNTDIPITSLASVWTPMGWTLHILDALHSVMPWYATIALSTIVIRMAMFPLVIVAQKNQMKMNEILPKIQELQQKATNARLSGNHLEFAKYSMEVQNVMKEHDYNPLRSLLVPLCQAPIFLTFFLTLRRMAQFPVESMKVGGILWFTDLTVSDPYYILPIITSVSLWAALELGVESGMNPNSSPIVKGFIRIVPIVTLLFISKFETGILMYWCSSNLISLLQVIILKQKSVRQFLNLPQPVVHKPEDLKKKTFTGSIRESWDNSKTFRKLEDRKRVDEINFKRAAIGPIKKTYKTDPTKVEKRN